MIKDFAGGLYINATDPFFYQVSSKVVLLFIVVSCENTLKDVCQKLAISLAERRHWPCTIFNTRIKN